MQIAKWYSVDFSNFNLDEITYCTDIAFLSSNEAWMTVFSPTIGKILKTNDGGLTWNEKYSSATGLRDILMLNYNEGLFIDKFLKVMYTNDGGTTLSELKYGQFNQPTFQWKKVTDFAMNGDGEIVAIAKDTGIPYQFRVCRANGAHTPFPDYVLPYDNEYGIPPNIVMNANSGILYNVESEDDPLKAYYMITNDGGVSWTGHQFAELENNNDLFLNDAFMPDENTIWIVGGEDEKALVMKSENGGITWTKTVYNNIPAFKSVSFFNDSEGYATISKSTSTPSSKLYKTIDGGATWEPVLEINTTYGMNKIYLLGSQIGFIAGKGETAYRYSVGK